MAKRRGLKTPPPATKTFWQRYQWHIIAGVAIFFIFTVIVPGLSSAPEETDTQTTGETGDRSVTIPEINRPADPNTGRRHLEPGETPPTSYSTTPPTSGPHSPSTAIWNIYTQPIADEFLVHNLEHGGIVIHYRPTTAASTVAQLTEFVQSQPNYPEGYILAPRENLPSAITISAWEYYLTQFQFNEQQMRSFVAAHYDQGPESLQGGAK